MLSIRSSVIALVLVAGCGSSSPSSNVIGSCDLHALGTCTDFGAGWMASTAKIACVAPGVFSASACARTGAAGCTVTAGGATHTTWSYTSSAADVMASCTQQNGTFVAGDGTSGGGTSGGGSTGSGGSTGAAGAAGGGAACTLTAPVGSCRLSFNGAVYRCEELDIDNSAGCMAATGTWVAGAKCPTAGLIRCCEGTLGAAKTVSCHYPMDPAPTCQSPETACTL